MEKLDQTYLNDLVMRAKTGSANAFAELFAASFEQEYSYILWMLNDEEKALAVLEEVYVFVHRNFSSLKNAGLFMPWIARISYRECARHGYVIEDPVRTPFGYFSVSQLLSAPVTESAVSLMYYAQKLSLSEISELLNYRERSLKRYLKYAKKHLLRNEEKIKEEALTSSLERKRITMKRPEAKETLKLLERVFKECACEANSVPLEALSSYAVYRKERFSLQRGILAGALALFLFLPALFIVPRYHVEALKTGERGLPVYSVIVKSLLPTASVTAKLGKHALPVYEAERRKFTIEPTRNGELTIEVELFNHQKTTVVHTVVDVDAKSPHLLENRIEKDTVILVVADEGIGVDYREIYGIDESGTVIRPLSYDPKSGEVIFAYPKINCDVYVPDHIGNTLHLAFTLD